MTSWEPTDKSITGLLDHGSKMLLYFEEFESRYLRAFGDTDTTIQSYKTLHTRYYEQNGMNEAALVDTFEAVSAAAKAMADEHDRQQTIAQSIAQAWQGSAASTAQEMIKTQLELASTDAEAAKSIAAALEKAPTALREAVKIKSDMVLQILEDGIHVKIDGKDAEDIDAIIQGAEGISWSNLWSGSSEANRIRRIFPDMEEGFGDWFTSAGTRLNHIGIVFPGSDYEQMVKDRCQHWLDNVFKPEYPAKIAKFTDACDRTHQKVLEAYAAITDEMAGLGAYRYPQPQGASSQNTPSEDAPSPSGDTPGSTPAGTDTPSSTDTPTTPASNPTSTDTDTDTDDDDSTNPAGTSNPLSGLTDLSRIASQLSPLLTSLTEGVQSALTSLTTTVDEEIDKALENLKNLTSTEEDQAEGVDADGDGKPDAETEPLAEFDLAGKEVTFEQGEDGLKMVVTTPDGTTTEYRMTIDENGVPLISTESGEPVGEGEGDEETPAEGSPAVEEQPAGSGAVPSAPAPTKQEDDGEYTPQPIPAPEFTEDEAESEAPAPAEPVSEQPPVDDTGALLAEAGPL